MDLKEEPSRGPDGGRGLKRDHTLGASSILQMEGVNLPLMESKQTERTEGKHHQQISLLSAVDGGSQTPAPTVEAGAPPSVHCTEQQNKSPSWVVFQTVIFEQGRQSARLLQAIKQVTLSLWLTH